MDNNDLKIEVSIPAHLITSQTDTNSSSPSVLNEHTSNVLCTSSTTSEIDIDPSWEESTQSIYSRIKKENDLDNIGEFFFESDHLALKVNSDYQNALQAMAILQAQRIKAIKDLDQLRSVKDEALADPISFVESLQKKKNFELPEPQCVANPPKIDWSKYALKNGCRSFMTHHRLSKSKFTPGFGPNDDSEESNQDKTQFVRGRVYSKNKPATFNQLWTTEEQKRLEELLVIYPPEEVESRRFAKIAAELGNRTTTQVASRVQKYFIKLIKAGIPVPGRHPNVKAGTAYNRWVQPRRRTSGISNRLTQLQTSTFFRHKFPAFYNLGESNEADFPMQQQNCDNDDGSQSPSTAASISGERDKPTGSDIEEINEPKDEDQDEIPDDLEDDQEIRELMFLKKLRESKLQSNGLAQHVGYRCDRCNCSPISGTRWHCTDCPPNHSTDFCNDCVDCQHEQHQHKASHHMQPIKQAESSKPFLDRDYIHFMGGDYNYLDPNYMPAA